MGEIVKKLIIIGLVIALISLVSACVKQGDIAEVPEDNNDVFCGTSTNGSCTTDDDCMTSGCSGQVCQNKEEPEAITTCIALECYNNEKYGLTCQCKNNQCQWS